MMSSLTVRNIGGKRIGRLVCIILKASPKLKTENKVLSLHILARSMKRAS